MVTKKDLVIVALATFCLTATLFLINPTRSSQSRYDPSLDVNHDGTINILDISAVAKSWASSGDPTVPVNVTNWPDCWLRVKHCNYDQYYYNISVYPDDWWWLPSFPTAGFKQISVFIKTDETIEVANKPNAYVYYVILGGGLLTGMREVSYSPIPIDQYNFGYYMSSFVTNDVAADEVAIAIHNPANNPGPPSIGFNVWVYVTA